MSIFGDLLSFGGSYLGDREQAAANNRLAQVQQNQQDFEKQMITTPRQDALGNVVGPHSVDLSPDSQALANQRLATSNQVAQNRGQQAQQGGDLASQFSGTQIRGPLSRQEAQGIIDKDNQRQFNAVVDPITDKLSMQAMRRFGNTSNLGDFTTQATQQILPAIQFGGEREALALSDADMDRFIKNTLSLGTDLTNTAAADNIQLPTMNSMGEIANSINAVGTPSTVPISGSSALFNSMAQLGNQINARDQQAQATAQSNRLIDLLERQLGNQSGGFSGGINTPSTTI